MLTQKGEIVSEYLREFPDVPSLTLARMVYNENIEVFRDVEAARTLIRYYRGSNGEKQRKHKQFKWEGRYNPFDDLPEPLEELTDWEPHIIDGKKILILCDIHSPFYSKTALQIALEYGYKKDVDTIILNGDVVDHYSVSSWEKDPRKKDFDAEIEITIKILEVIRRNFPRAIIYWKEANHEERYERYMAVKSPELINVKKFSMQKVYELDENNIEYIGEKRVLKVQGLHIVHGHEFGRSIFSPVNPARGLYLRAKDHAVCGHYHQSSNHSENSISDQFTGCWSIGCLSNMHPKWLPINKWNWGFGYLENNSEDDWQMHNKKIMNYKVYNV